MRDFRSLRGYAPQNHDTACARGCQLGRQVPKAVAKSYLLPTSRFGSLTTDLSLILRALFEIGGTALNRGLGVERCQTSSTVLFCEL